ncbi:MAG: hypothetical protein QM817_03975 [Archangium sp.]
MTERRQRRVQHVETKGSSYEELEPVGEAMGFGPTRGLKTTFKLDSVTCAVSLDINSGSVVGSHFSVRFEGPQQPVGPTMKLRRETPTDVEDKNKFVSVEVQVGDEDFDLEVYIDSTAAEPEVKRFLARAETRRAARWIVDRGFTTITIDRDGVTADTTERPLHFRSEMPQLFECLMELSRAGALRGEIIKPRGGFMLALSTLGAVVGGFFLCGTANALEGVMWLSLIPGIATGFIGFAVSKPLIEQMIAGHSASGGRARLIAATLGFTLGCFATFFAAHWLAPGTPQG